MAEQLRSRAIAAGVAQDQIDVASEAQGHVLSGRLHAAQGHRAEAEAAFEAAADVSRRTDQGLSELFALRDLKRLVLDGDGRGDEGERRLGEAMSRWDARWEEHTRVLWETAGHEGKKQKPRPPLAELTALLGKKTAVDAEAVLKGDGPDGPFPSPRGMRQAKAQRL